VIIHLFHQWRYQTMPWGAMMFLLSAQRMTREYSRLRPWLILALRTLAETIRFDGGWVGSVFVVVCAERAGPT
jgi:hypothetical protein